MVNGVSMFLFVIRGLGNASHPVHVPGTVGRQVFELRLKCFSTNFCFQAQIFSQRNRTHEVRPLPVA